MSVSVEQLLRLAQAKGWLHTSQAHPAASNSGSQSPEPWQQIASLIEQGCLTWSQLAELIQEAGASAAGSAGSRYRLERFLGAGGMAEVYLARDTQLGRPVALKRLRPDAFDLRSRFLREAQTQARVDHENICRIFDTGEQEGYPFIAMQFIDGQTLDRAAKAMALEEKLRLMRDAAEGLHAAHRLGLIHRDIKPANIMVAKGEGGITKPTILDFGLVRDSSQESLTVAEDFIGSPHYMSPEQIGGDSLKIDRRTDVYSLGITLYQILCDQLPFSDDNLAGVIIKVVQQEPRPLRAINPAIPLDVETIVMECLEKNPDQRYGSARELAADLSRFLNGEPILARRCGMLPRLVKKAKKHKAVTAFAAAAFLLLALMAGLWLRAGWRSRQRAEIASQFGREVEAMEAEMRYAHLLRPHDIRPDRQTVRDRMATIERRMTTLGGIAAGPGHYALGQGYLALQEYGQAREHLEQAAREGFRPPEALYAMGLALGQLYNAELSRAERIADKTLREVVKERLEKEYSQPALQLLKTARPNPETPLAYVEALIAFYEKRYADALKKLETDSSRNDRFYEVQALAGEIHRTLGKRHLALGDLAAARREYEVAAKALEDALAVGRSDPQILLHLGGLSREMSYLPRTESKKNEPPPLDKAMGFCDQALAIAPDLAAVYTSKADIWNSQGSNLLFDDRDPDRILGQALAAAKKAMELQPDDDYPVFIAGNSHYYKMLYKNIRGIESTEDFSQAIAFYRKSILLNPNNADARKNIPYTYYTKAQQQFATGADPGETIRIATKIAVRLEKKYPDLPMFHHLHATIRELEYRYRLQKGVDVWPVIEQAIASLRQAMQLEPADIRSYINCGKMYVEKARCQIDFGQNPEGAIKQALELEDRALQINPKNATALYFTIRAHLELARYSMLHGRDPEPELRLAETYLARIRSANAHAYPVYRAPALISINLIRVQRAFWQGQSAEAAIAASERKIPSAQEMAEAINRPDDLWPYLQTLEIHAWAQMGRGASPQPTIGAAVALLQKATQARPDSFAGHRLLAEFSLLDALERMRRGKNPETSFAQARQQIGVALELNRSRPESHLTQANLCYWQSRWQRSQNLNPRAGIDKGLASVDRALAVNPDSAEAYVLKGILLQARAGMDREGPQRQEDSRQARENLTRGYAINPLLKNSRVFQPHAAGLTARENPSSH